LKPVNLPGRGCTFPDHHEQASQAKAGVPPPAGKVHPIPTTIVADLAAVLPAGEQEASLMDRIVREGARRMLAAALQAEGEWPDTGWQTRMIDDSALDHVPRMCPNTTASGKVRR
jgi:hypothetical protein